MGTQATTPVPTVPVQWPAQAPPLVITLVHGTILFARWPLWRKPRAAKNRSLESQTQGTEPSIPRTTPEWFEEGSQFRRRLQKALGIPCVVTQFEWSGANREWDRLCAAGADADFYDRPSARATPSAQGPTLREHIAQYPGAAHVLIAHSHGGNVCLAALNDPQTRRAVHALVCLSTPFINVRGRADSPALMQFSQAAGAVSCLVALFGSIALIDRWVPKPWSSTTWVGGVLLVIFPFVVYGVFSEPRRKALRRWASAKRRGVAEPSMLALISDGDEALLVLKIAEGLNAALRGLWRLAVGIPLRIFAAQRRLGNNLRLSLPILAVVMLLVLGAFLTADVTSPLRTGDWSPLILLKFLGAALVASTVLIVLWCFTLALPGLIMVTIGFLGLSFVRWLAFGWAGYLGVEMTAETCPIGTAQITRLGPSLRARGLRHGHSYNDRRAPVHIARFIRETMAAKGWQQDPGAGHHTAERVIDTAPAGPLSASPGPARVVGG